MNIIYVQISGSRKIVTFRARFSGASVVEFRGDNDTGKSSAIDALYATLVPPRANAKQKDYETLVNDGMDKAVLTEVLGVNGVGHYEVKRTLNKQGVTTGLTVTDLRENTIVKSPQKFLDDLMSFVAKDPLMFLEKPADEQFAMIAALKKVDLTSADKDIARAEADRSQAKEALKAAEATLALREADAQAVRALIPEEVSASGVPVDSSSARKRREEILQTKKKVDELTANRDRTIALLKGNKTKRENYLALLAALDKSDKECEDYLDYAEGALEDLNYDPEALDRLDETLANAGAINAALEKVQAAQAAKMKADVALETARRAEKAVETARADRRKMVASTPCPVKDIDIDPETRLVTYRGKPLNDASTAQKILASVDLAIAENPKLKVLFLKDGSALGASALAEVARRAAEAGFQIILESVDRNATNPNVFEVVGAEDVEIQTSSTRE